MTHDSRLPWNEGLGASLRGLGAGVLRVLQTRLEILSSEFAEERHNLTRVVFLTTSALFCLHVGSLLAILFIVLAVGRANWLAAIGIAALVLLLGALGAVLWLRRWLISRPPMFATSIAELRKDRDRLVGK